MWAGIFVIFAAMVEAKANDECTVCSSFKSTADKFMNPSSSRYAPPINNQPNPASDERPKRKCSDSIANPLSNVVANAPLECPPDKDKLGRHTWTFLHTTAAYYPTIASEQDKKSMHMLISGVAQHYPCSYCASHFQKDMKDHEIQLGGNAELSKWLCEVHNRVNARQGKEAFDCSRVFERWRTGCQTKY